jgi:general secretion pathway protein G
MSRKTSKIVLTGVVIALGLITYAYQDGSLIFSNGCGQGGVAQVFVTDSIAYVLNNYRKDTGTYPTTAQGLPALITAPEGVKNWHGPYLTTKVTPLDPWGNEYQYTFPGVNNPESYDVWSRGPNGLKAPSSEWIGNW